MKAQQSDDDDQKNGQHRDRFTQDQNAQNGKNEERRLEYINVERVDAKGLESCRSLSISDAAGRVLDISGMFLLERLLLDYVSMDQLVAGHHQNLTSLKISNSKLASLDVSQMPRLKSLHIVWTRINSLDVSALQELVVLHCQDQLRHFVMGRHPHMRELTLRLSCKQLMHFDISEMPELTKLDLKSSRINSLRTGANLNLTTLDLKETSLTELDIAGMPNLIELNIAETGITHLDMRQLTQLQVFKSSQNFNGFDVYLHPNLRELVLRSRETTFLDLSAVPELQKLDIRASAIQELDITQSEHLQDLIASLFLQRVIFGRQLELRNLWLYQCQLTELDISALPALHMLHVGHSNISVLRTGCATKLNEINISDTQIKHVDLRGLNKLNYFNATNSQLRYCDLRDAVALRKLMLKNTQMRFLRFAVHCKLEMIRIDGNALYCDFRDVTDINYRYDYLFVLCKNQHRY